MKIALLHYTAPPVIGGVETVLAAHARLLARAGHDVRVICARGGEKLPDGVQLARIPAGDAAALHAALTGCDTVIFHNVATMPFDLVWTETLWRLADELPHVRWISWMHDLAAANPDYAPTPELLRRAHPRWVCVTISELRRREFRALAGADCRVIPNGLDPLDALALPPPLAALADAAHWLERDIVLLHPARFVRRKNIEQTVRVTAELKARGLRIAALITGAPDPHHAPAAAYAEELRALRHTLDVRDEVIFLHEHLTVDDTTMAALYRIADAVLFPSKQEGFGLPLIEAGLHRIPIFAPQHPPFSEYHTSPVELYPPETSAADLAALLAKTAPFSPRKTIIRNATWRHIYQTQLAPLLGT